MPKPSKKRFQDEPSEDDLADIDMGFTENDEDIDDVDTDDLGENGKDEDEDEE